MLSALTLFAYATAGQSTLPDWSPVVAWSGNRGMTQVQSAEPLGDGRLSFAIRGAISKQDQAFPQTPDKDAQIGTFSLAVANGVSPNISLYARQVAYASSGWTTDHPKGLGSFTGGFHASLPAPEGFPLRLAMQIEGVAGTATEAPYKTYDSLRGRSRADGYDWMDLRTGSDVVGRLLQSLIFGTDQLQIRLHANQGLNHAIQGDHKDLLLLGGGFELQPGPWFVFGLEANSRTVLKKIDGKDPLWLTPSIQLRTPYAFNVATGLDFSLAKKRPDNSASLNPWRLFGSFSFSFDLMAKTRALARERFARDSLDREDLRAEVARYKIWMDSAQRQAKEDSAAMADLLRQKELRADSLARKAQEDSLRLSGRLRNDSLSSADRARRDSIALAEATRKLSEERGKRDQLEADFLRTGVLALDAVYFDAGKARISRNSLPYLNLIGQILIKYTKLRLEVGGHTDNKGKAAANLKLSQQRAQAVKDWLINTFPELSTIISAKGYGSTKPKADNTTAEGREQNRRVEITVKNPNVLKEYAAPSN